MRENHWYGEEIIKNSKRNILQGIIVSKLSDVKLHISLLTSSGKIKGMTASEIKKAISSHTEPSADVKEQERTFQDYFEKRFIKLQKNKNTTELYRYTYRTVSGFTDVKKLTFSMIDKSFLKDFELHISKTCDINTRAIHFRNIRTIYNSAIDDEDAHLDKYPFRRFKIKTTPTIKRSLTLSELRRLKD